MYRTVRDRALPRLGIVGSTWNSRGHPTSLRQGMTGTPPVAGKLWISGQEGGKVSPGAERFHVERGSMPPWHVDLLPLSQRHARRRPVVSRETPASALLVPSEHRSIA